jgi:hypothetical protein
MENLGNGFTLEDRGSSIRIYRKIIGTKEDIIFFDYTNQDNPDESSFKFEHSLDRDSSEGTFYSEFSQYIMIVVNLYNSAYIELTTATAPLIKYHIPVNVAESIIEYGIKSQKEREEEPSTSTYRQSSYGSEDPEISNNTQDGGRRRRKQSNRRQTKRRQTKRRRTIKRKY